MTNTHDPADNFPIAYQGSLAEYTAGSILLSLHAQEETGALILSRGRAMHKFHLRRGEPVWIQTTAAARGFLRYLHDHGHLAPAVLEAWADQLTAGSPGEGFAALLERRAGIDAGRYADLERAWLIELLQNFAPWREGEFVFFFDEAPQTPATDREPLDLDRFVFAGTYGRVPTSYLRQRYRDQLGNKVTMCEADESIIERFDLPAPEARIVRDLAAGQTIRQAVLGSMLPSSTGLSLVFALETMAAVDCRDATFRVPTDGAHGGEIGVEGMALIQRLKSNGADLLKRKPIDMLGIRRGCSEEELRKAYYVLAQEYHQKELVDLLPPELRELSYRIFDRASAVFEALVMWEKRRVAGAFATFERFDERAIDPDNASHVRGEAAFFRGRAAAASGDFAGARRHFEAAIEEGIPQSIYRAWLAWARLNDDSDPTLQRHLLTDFRQCIEEEPGNAEIRHLYGLALEKQGAADRAFEQYVTGLDLDPGNRDFLEGKRRTYPPITQDDVDSVGAETDKNDHAEEGRLRATLAQMEKGSFFEILGLDQEASTDAIRRRYFELVKVYHPDRFKATRLQPVAERLFILVNEAYETLSNRQRRDAYVSSLKTIEDQKVVKNEEKRHSERRLLRKGKGFIQANNWQQAADHFGEIVNEGRYEEPLFKAYYAWALFNLHYRDDPAILERVEQMLQEVVKADAELAEVYVIWGKIYRRLDKLARAKKYFDQALHFEENNIDALREIRLINQRLTGDPTGNKAIPDTEEKPQKRIFGSLFGRKKN